MRRTYLTVAVVTAAAAVAAAPAGARVKPNPITEQNRIAPMPGSIDQYTRLHPMPGSYDEYVVRVRLRAARASAATLAH